MLNVLNSDDSATPAPVVLTKAQQDERRRLEQWLEGRITEGKKRATAEVVTLVPTLAELLLERNPINRPMSPRNASDLASDIAEGRFEFNGESIVVSRTGVLIDGQHRCAQVAVTRRPIETVIVFGPKDEARFTIDIGKSKTVSNFLAMKGRTYTHALAAAVSYCIQLRQKGSLTHSGSQDKPTKVTVLAAADELKGIDTSIEFTADAMKTVKAHAVVAFCHYTFWKRASRELADEFINRLIDGDGLRRGNAIHYCRNRLLGMSRGITAQAKAELIFKCWNAWRLNHGIDHFKLTGGKLPKVER